MSSKSWLRDRIENDIGRPILDNYCQRKDGTSGPFMMPPIPDSRFIDKLPDDNELKGANVQEKEHQDAYEAEVKVYRCIEEMDTNHVVIHQLEYTHEQYSLFLPNHKCNKKTKNQMREIEGECDFVVIGDRVVAVLEVKGLSLQGTEDDSMKFKGCCDSAQKQRKRMSDLIKSIEPTVMVFDCTVFPNISKKEVDEQYDETILFSEDLENLKYIISCDEKVSSLPITVTVVKTVRDKLCCCLLGLWCINQQNKWELKICSLSYCITDTNTKLIRALVTRKLIDEAKQNACQKKKKGKEKKYPENPEMVVAPDLFKDHLKINCLTKHQLDIFNSKERFLWVDGPAGAGKTIAMLGKIIDLALNTPPEKRILLMMIGVETTPIVLHHMGLLNNISDDITCEMIVYDYGEGDITDQLNEAYNSLSQQMSDCNSKIVLLVINKGFSKSVESYLTSFDKVFVDDYQLFVDNIHYNALDCRFADECNDIISMGLIPILINNDKSDTSVWVFFDEAQSFTDKYAHILPNRKMYIANMDSFKRYFVTSKLELSINLRNILEISTVLSIIRRHYQKLDFTKSATGSATGSANWPHQVGGHFLRGTKPVIYLLGENEPASWNDILIGEMEKLLGSGSHLTNKDIAVLLSVNPDNLKLATETVYSITGRWDTTDNLITVQVLGHSVSADSADTLSRVASRYLYHQI